MTFDLQTSQLSECGRGWFGPAQLEHRIFHFFRLFVKLLSMKISRIE